MSLRSFCLHVLPLAKLGLLPNEQQFVIVPSSGCSMILEFAFPSYVVSDLVISTDATRSLSSKGKDPRSGASPLGTTAYGMCSTTWTVIALVKRNWESGAVQM